MEGGRGFSAYYSAHRIDGVAIVDSGCMAAWKALNWKLENSNKNGFHNHYLQLSRPTGGSSLPVETAPAFGLAPASGNILGRRGRMRKLKTYLESGEQAL